MISCLLRKTIIIKLHRLLELLTNDNIIILKYAVYILFHTMENKIYLYCSF